MLTAGTAGTAGTTCNKPLPPEKASGDKANMSLIQLLGDNVGESQAAFRDCARSSSKFKLSSRGSVPLSRPDIKRKSAFFANLRSFA